MSSVHGFAGAQPANNPETESELTSLSESSKLTSLSDSSDSNHSVYSQAAEQNDPPAPQSTPPWGTSHAEVDNFLDNVYDQPGSGGNGSPSSDYDLESSTSLRGSSALEGQPQSASGGAHSQPPAHSSQFGEPLMLAAAPQPLAGAQEGEAGPSGVQKRERSEDSKDAEEGPAKRAKI